MPEKGTRAILYERVSTGEQTLGLSAQREQLEVEAKRRGWLAEHVDDEGVSGSTPAEDRAGLGPALDSLRPGDVLAVAKLDRLSRSVLDFARILRRAERGAWSIVVLDLGVDMTTPNGRLVAHVLAAVAEWEREMIAQRIREGMAASPKCFGHRSGAPAVGGGVLAKLPAEVVAAVTDLREAGKSPGAIAERLNEYGLPSLRGGRWHRTSVRRLLDRLDAEAVTATA